MGTHFIVLQLPGSYELKFTGASDPSAFWANAATHILKGNAKVICNRCDTGVSEELRDHIKTLNTYTTYLLLDMELDNDELQNEQAIFDKAVIQLRHADHEFVIDNDEHFQLVAIGA